MSVRSSSMYEPVTTPIWAETSSQKSQNHSKLTQSSLKGLKGDKKTAIVSAELRITWKNPSETSSENPARQWVSECVMTRHPTN